MLFIITGIVIFWFSFRIAVNSSKIDGETLLGIFILCIVIALVGIFIPVSGYNEPKLVDEIPLVSLSNDLGTEGKSNLIFVRLSNENVYSYRHEIESQFGTETSTEYKVDTVSENVDEIEDPKCEKAVLRIYKQKPKRNFITFAICGTKTYYAFYVPKGTIVKEIKLD